MSNIYYVLLNVMPASSFDSGKLLKWFLSFFFNKNYLCIAITTIDIIVNTGLITFGIWKIVNGRFTSGIIICTLGIALREIYLKNMYPYLTYNNWRSLKFSEFMFHNQITVPVTLSNHKCIHKFVCNPSLQSFPVVGNNNFFYGTISQSTIYSSLPSEKNLDSYIKRVEMCDSVFTTETFKTAKNKFISGTNTLPVIDNKGYLAGIITLNMIMELLVYFFEHRKLITTMHHNQVCHYENIIPQ
jgi:predicted transcriptional regulator